MTFTATSFPLVSPNGQYVAFSAGGSAGTMLYVRPWGSFAVQSFPGTEGAVMPFWSPDSLSLGFFAQGKLKKVDLAGGLPQTMADLAQGEGGAWSPDGTIVLANYSAGPLLQIPASGGPVKPLTTLDAARHETHQARPFFLPDGHHFLYLSMTGEAGKGAIMVCDTRNPTSAQFILASDSNAAYAATGSGGYLLFVSSDVLMAQPFDADHLKLSGAPIPVAEQVAPTGYLAGSAFSASNNGVLAYRTGGGDPNTQLVWFDRSGKRLEALGEAGSYSNPALSPDDQRLAVSRMDPGVKSRDIWVYDLAHGTSSQLTSNPADDVNPVWSPDGTRIAFTSERKGKRDIYQKASSGAGDDEILLSSPDRKSAEDWSPDGRWILYNSRSETNQGVWMLPLSGDRKPVPFLVGAYNVNLSRVSPNGRWIAYRSTETGGGGEIFVQSFPSSGGKWQVSNSGGTEPSWRRDGKELYYVKGQTIMAVDIIEEGSTLKPGVPKPLFEVPLLVSSGRNNYVVTAKGQRFLVNMAVQETVIAPFSVVFNWSSELKH
jgi:Tol biopolymer transport system component